MDSEKLDSVIIDDALPISLTLPIGRREHEKGESSDSPTATNSDRPGAESPSKRYGPERSLSRIFSTDPRSWFGYPSIPSSGFQSKSSGSYNRRSFTREKLSATASLNVSRKISGTRNTLEITSEALQFEEDEAHLLRALTLEDVLHNRAAIFSESWGGTASYGLSRTVPKIDYFISHNWTMSRSVKFFSLSLHFNLSFAIAFASAVSILCFFLHVDEILPSRDAATVQTDALVRAGMFSHLLTAPSLLCVLMFKHDVSKLVRHGPSCFLDKACIHQTDAALKQKSIMKLGAFLSKSDRILILYSNVYLKKLWTIYEVACFSVLHPSSHIELVHTSCVNVFFLLTIALYMWTSTWYFHEVVPVPPILHFYMVLILGTLIYAKLTRRGHRDLLQTWDAADDFDVQTAWCLHESDRPIVEKNIAAFMITLGYARYDADKEEALNAFNLLVRRFVIEGMKNSLGASPLPFVHFIVILLCVSFANSLDIASGIILKFGWSDIRAWGYILRSFTHCCSHVPLLGEALCWFTAQAPHLSGWKEWGFIVLGSFSAFLSFVLIASAMMWTEQRVLQAGGHFNVFSCLYCLANVLSLAATIIYVLNQRRNRSKLFTELDHRIQTQARKCTSGREPSDMQSSMRMDNGQPSSPRKGPASSNNSLNHSLQSVGQSDSIDISLESSFGVVPYETDGRRRTIVSSESSYGFFPEDCDGVASPLNKRIISSQSSVASEANIRSPRSRRIMSNESSLLAEPRSRRIISNESSPLSEDCTRSSRTTKFSSGKSSLGLGTGSTSCAVPNERDTVRDPRSRRKVASTGKVTVTFSDSPENREEVWKCKESLYSLHRSEDVDASVERYEPIRGRMDSENGAYLQDKHQGDKGDSHDDDEEDFSMYPDVLAV